MDYFKLFSREGVQGRINFIVNNITIHASFILVNEVLKLVIGEYGLYASLAFSMYLMFNNVTKRTRDLLEEKSKATIVSIFFLALCLIPIINLIVIFALIIFPGKYRIPGEEKKSVSILTLVVTLALAVSAKFGIPVVQENYVNWDKFEIEFSKEMDVVFQGNKDLSSISIEDKKFLGQCVSKKVLALLKEKCSTNSCLKNSQADQSIISLAGDYSEECGMQLREKIDAGKYRSYASKDGKCVGLTSTVLEDMAFMRREASVQLQELQNGCGNSFVVLNPETNARVYFSDTYRGCMCELKNGGI